MKHKIRCEMGRVLIIPAVVRNVVGLSFDYEAYIEKMAELAKYCISRDNKVELMAFCRAFHDDDACYAIFNRLNEAQRKSVDIYIYGNDMDEAIEHIQRAEYIIPTRFHGMILGWCCQRKVYPIVYTKKQSDEIETLHFSGKFFRIDNISQLDVESVLFQASQLNGMKTVQDEAQRHFAAIEGVF